MRRLSSGVLLLGLLGWLSAPAAQEDAPPDIVIGVIAGFTGKGASYGIGIRQGAEMAVREINDAGGIEGRRLRLVLVDDGSEPARSAIVMRRLVSTNPALIIGGWGSAQVLAHAEFAEAGAVPYIVVAASSPAITRADNRWVFRVMQNDQVAAEQLAHHVVTRLGQRRIAVLYERGAYGIGSRDVFVAALERLGVRNVRVEGYHGADPEVDEVLRRIKSANPEALAIFGTLPAAPRIMNRARAMGITARFLGTGGIAANALLMVAPDAAEGTVAAAFFHEASDAAALAWSERYHREFAAEAQTNLGLAAWEYRAIRDIAVPCLRQAGASRPALRECIATWQGPLFGVQGSAHFDHTGQLVYPSVMIEVRDGAFRPVDPPR